MKRILRKKEGLVSARCVTNEPCRVVSVSRFLEKSFPRFPRLSRIPETEGEARVLICIRCSCTCGHLGADAIKTFVSKLLVRIMCIDLNRTAAIRVEAAVALQRASPTTLQESKREIYMELEIKPRLRTKGKK